MGYLKINIATSILGYKFMPPHSEIVQYRANIKGFCWLKSVAWLFLSFWLDNQTFPWPYDGFIKAQGYGYEF